MMTGYLLSQQPDTKHLSILGRQCHSPDVAHRLLNGTWLRSASHNRKSSEPHPPCDLLLWLSQHAALHWRLRLGGGRVYLEVPKQRTISASGSYKNKRAYHRKLEWMQQLTLNTK